MTNHAPALEAAIASEIRAEMGRRRKSRADLAQTLGVHPATAARRLDGEVPFDIVELCTVADWLGLTVTELIARAERLTASERIPA